MKIIVGLGNPTKKYSLTRHNVGFLAIDKIADTFFVKLKKSDRFGSLIGEGSFRGEKIFLMKPLAYMNLSGGPVSAFAGEKNIDSEDIMVVCDDIYLDLGKIRIRKSGSSGGHKGLKSVIENLGTNKFARIKIGIGQDEEGAGLSEYVLKKFSKKDFILVGKVLDVVADAVKTYLADGINIAMTRFNGLKIC